MGKKGQAKMVNPSRKPHCNEDVACFNKFGPGGASSSSEKANKHERALVSAPDENEEMSRKKCVRVFVCVCVSAQRIPNLGTQRLTNHSAVLS